MIGVGLITLYYLTPDFVIDKIIEKTIFIVRYLFTDKIEELEENIRKTFQVKVMYPIPERSIRIWSPHGLTVLSGGIHEKGFNVTSSQLKSSKFVTHNVLHYWPIVKDILRHYKSIPSDYTTIKNTVEKESISMSIGGVQEMNKIKEKNIQLIISRRKGIFKIALETGTPIVPILTYGENEVFPRMDLTFLKYFNNFLYKYFKVSFPYPSFAALQNWFTLSYKSLDPILSYTGKPIYTKKIENPSDKHITKLRNIYIQRMKDLFEQTNDGTYTLEIV